MMVFHNQIPFLEKKYNWYGLLIEPSEKFKELIKVRSSKIFSLTLLVVHSKTR